MLIEINYEVKIMEIYVLKQAGYGVISYSENEAKIKERYNEETSNGRFGGYEIKKLDVDCNIFNMNVVDFWNYLTNISSPAAVKFV